MTTQNGTLSGSIKKNNVKPGSHKIKLYGFTGAKWEKNSADISETLVLNIFSEGMDGQSVSIQFYEGALNKPGTLIDTKETKISGDQTNFQWKLPQDKLKNQRASKRPSMPRYYFVANVKKLSRSMPSLDFLELTTTIKISLLDDQKKAVANEPFTIKLATGAVITSNTDRNGKAEIKKVPIGVHNIQFTKNPLIAPDKPIVIESPQRIQSYKLDIFNENKFFANSYIVRCNHLVDDIYRFIINPPYFAVVQDAPGQEKDSIHIYSDHKKQLSEKSGITVEIKEESSFTKSILKCGYKGKTDFKMILNPHFWKDYNTPTNYEIQGLRKNLAVHAYCPNEFNLAIKFPAPEKFKIGKEYAGKGRYAGEGGWEYSKGSMEKFHQKFHFEDKEGQWGKIEHPLVVATTDRPIALTVDDKEIEISALDSFGSVLIIAKNFRSIIDLITKSMPKVGYYASIDYKFMEGQLAFGWKWKEYIDHRVYANMAASIDLTLVAVEIEIGVGFSAFTVVGQIFFQLNGEITLGLQAERSTPDMGIEAKIPFGAKIEGVGGARTKVSVFVTVEYTVSTAIELADGAFKVNVKEGISVGGNLKWTGIKGKLKTSAGPGKANGKKELKPEQATSVSTCKEQVWVEEADWGRFDFPKKNEYAQEYLTDEDIKGVLKKVFTKDYHLVIESKIIKQKMGMDEVVNEIVSCFPMVPLLDRGARSIEGIAFDIKGTLSNFLSITTSMGSFSAAVPYKRFQQFCHDGELLSKLKKAENQIQILQNKLKK